MGGVNSKILDTIDTLNDENKKILETENDLYTNILVATLPGSLIGVDPVPGSVVKTAEVDLGWRKGWFSNAWHKDPAKVSEINIENETAKLVMHILDEDDIHGKDKASLVLLTLLRSPIILPLSDKSYVLESDDKAMEVLEQLKLNQGGGAYPEPYQTWEEMTSDEAISRFFFYGIGSVLVHSQSAIPNQHPEELGPLVVDIDLTQYEVRPGCAKYGSRLHFDADQNITAIFDYGTHKLVKPGEGQIWERAKFVAKVTAFTKITIHEHLLWTHLVLSNTMTRVKSQELPPDHPLRRLLTVFTFRTNLVNNNALEALIPNLSLIFRASGFTFDAITKAYLAGYTQCNIFQPFPQQDIGEEVKKMSEAGTFPYHSEGMAWFDIVRTFVSEWVEKAGESCLEDEHAKKFFQALEGATRGQKYGLSALNNNNKDAQIDVLTQMIWIVTGYHELVGFVVDYTSRPSFAGLRALEDPSITSVDMQSFLITMIITASTSLRMPILADDFENFFGKGGAPEWEIEVWANFQKAIKEQSEKVQAADKERKTEFKSFDPARFECAVSV